MKTLKLLGILILFTVTAKAKAQQESHALLGSWELTKQYCSDGSLLNEEISRGIESLQLHFEINRLRVNLIYNGQVISKTVEQIEVGDEFLTYPNDETLGQRVRAAYFLTSESKLSFVVNGKNQCPTGVGLIQAFNRIIQSSN